MRGVDSVVPQIRFLDILVRASVMVGIEVKSAEPIGCNREVNRCEDGKSVDPFMKGSYRK